MTTNTDNKTAVILINMGGPESLSDIKLFIRALFSDPAIMQVSQPFRSINAYTMSLFRTPRIKEHYKEIGGKSPLIKTTNIQAEKTKEKLKTEFPHLEIVTAFSYSKPGIKDTIIGLVNNRFERIIALPLYPQYSTATFGSVEREINIIKKYLPNPENIIIISPFFDHPLYIKATVKLLEESLDKINRSEPFRVAFTAHALPQSYIDKGDPYRKQIEETVSLILKDVAVDNYKLAFQSKVGPVKWIQPSTIETIKETAGDNIKQVLVMPIGFVCDHLETLYELDIELAAIAKAHGIETFIRAGVFNDQPLFIELLASLIRDALS